MLFCCLRQIIFCKFTVTSVLFSVYIDSKITCNRCVHDHCIFTLRVCVFIRRYECVCEKNLIGKMSRKKLARSILHFEEIVPINDSSAFSVLFLTQSSECLFKSMEFDSCPFSDYSFDELFFFCLGDNEGKRPSCD